MLAVWIALWVFAMLVMSVFGLMIRIDRLADQRDHRINGLEREVRRSRASPRR